MTKDISRTVCQVTESFRDIGSQERFEQIFRFRSEVSWITNSTSDDLFVESHRVRIFCEERWVSSLQQGRGVSIEKETLVERNLPTHKHFKHQYTESVPIYTLVVSS